MTDDQRAPSPPAIATDVAGAGGSAVRPAPRGAVSTMLGGIALIVLGAFLPWVISGATTRSSFATVRTADRLGLVPDGAALLVLRAWYLVPLAAALVPLFLALHHVRTAATVAIALAALTGLIATIVLVVAPERGVGPMVSIAGSAAVLASALTLLLHRRRISRP
jgi:hypothetical protein